MPSSLPPASAVTVVMATRNRRDDALSALAHLQGMQPPSPLVVVDNASSDGTAGAVRRAHPDVDVVRLAENVGACARNVGVRRAETAYVAFSDDDSWWADGALERAAAVLDAHPRVAVVMARIVVRPDEVLDPICAQMARAPLGTVEGTPYPRVVGFVACGAVVRRTAFLEVGGFHPVVRFPGEEQALSLDLMASGWELAHVDDVVAHHHPEERPDRRDRTSDILRSQLLTTWLREPWWVCARDTGRAAVRSVRSSPHRRALSQALGRVGAVRRGRRVTPSHVRRDVARAGAAAAAWDGPERVPPRHASWHRRNPAGSGRPRSRPLRRGGELVVNPEHVADLLRTLAGELSRHREDLGMPRRLCLAAASLSRAPGVALTLAYATAERITLCATDDVAARLEDLQDVLSQGPGQLAFTAGVHVRALLDHVDDPRWPELSGAVRDELGPVLVEAFPMRSGGEVVGVLTYHLEPGSALALDRDDGQLVADLVGGAAVEHDPANELQMVEGIGPWADRSAIHQATGMVMAQLRLGAADAMALLKAHSFASAEPLSVTAHRVLGRTLDFRTTDSSEGSSP